MRIARDLEAAYDVGHQTVGLPMPHDRAGTDSQSRSHLAHTPVRGCRRRGSRGQVHQLGYIHLHRGRAARQVALNALQPTLQIAFTPACDLYAPDTQLLSNVLVLQALRGQQHDLRSLRKPGQFALLFIRQKNRRATLMYSLQCKPY